MATRTSGASERRCRFQFCIERFQSARRLFLQLLPSRGSPAGVAHGQPRPCTTSWGFEASEPNHFRARIQSFQAVAAPFPGNSARRRRPDPRNALGKERKRRNEGGLPSFLSKLFQIQAVFRQGFPKKALAFCGISRGYKSSKRQLRTFQIFRRRRSPFGRISGAAGPHSASERRMGFEGGRPSRRFTLK